ncbi:ATP-dependent helicase C-terminal domain-containing protein [Shigella flexneri]
MRIAGDVWWATDPTIARGTCRWCWSCFHLPKAIIKITRDLSAFWKGTYREVQREMKRAFCQTYFWPEQPGKILHRRDGRKSIGKVGFLPLPVARERAGVRAWARTYASRLTLLPKGKGVNGAQILEIGCSVL